MLRLIFVRHGQSEDNRDKKLLGHSPKTPLTALGKKQAKQTADVLKKEYNIKKIYSSPLRRAMQTADIISKVLNISIVIDDRLREIERGLIEGETKETLKTSKKGRGILQFFDKFDKRSIFENTKNIPKLVKQETQFYKMIEAESDTEIYKRIDTFLRFIKKKSGDILIVSHGGLIRAIISRLFNINFYGVGDNYGKYPNCHITSILLKPKKYMELQMYSKHLT